MNVTPQRVAVYRALLESEDHPTPEMLYQAVSRDMPSLSVATIYKTLDALVSLGLVRTVPVDGDRRRYDANDETHHHRGVLQPHPGHQARGAREERICWPSCGRSDR